MTTDARQRLERIIEYLSDREGLVVDADVHITDPHLPTFSTRPDDLGHPDDYFHGKPLSGDQLVRNMDVNGVDLALAWQNPATTPYVDDARVNYERLKRANEYVSEVARTYPDRILPAGWTDPRALGAEQACDLARYCILELGMPIVKMNPAQNAFPIDSPEAIAVVDSIVALGAAPAFHFGADTGFTPASGLEAVARRIAPQPVIGVHMGGGGASYLGGEQLYRDARRLGLSQSNIHYVLSAKRDSHIETDLITYAAHGTSAFGSLSWGSDAPYGTQSWNLGGLRAMLARLASHDSHWDRRVRESVATFDHGVTRRLLGDNFGEIYRRCAASVLSAADAGRDGTAAPGS